MTHHYIGSPLLFNNVEIERPDFTQFPLWGVYFSAHWCMPCRRFTPYLASFYNQWKAAKAFELVFVSNDNSLDEFEHYTSMMPWLSVPYQDRFCISVLQSICQPNRIPTLCIFDSQGKLVTREGVSDLGNHGEKAYEMWLEQSKAQA